jgi:hypothetical protein
MGMKSPGARSAPMLPGIAALFLSMTPYAGADMGDTTVGVRESTTLYYDEGGRARTSLQARTDDTYDPLATEGLRKQPGASPKNGKTSTSMVMTTISEDFWIYYADVQLFADDDNDGFFYGIDVLFDADTYFEVADVYAVLYLSYEGGPWNEYAVTETFSIHGATSDDEFVVVTELRTGYPTGSYDLLIELYDTYDGAFVAELGPEDSSALGALPLEDFNRDDPRRHHHDRDGGGGSMDWWFALLLGIVAAAGIHRRTSTTAVVRNRRP